jgi:hypothetical protein
MKTYGELAHASAVSETAVNQFKTLSHIFYLQLNKQLIEKMKIPDGGIKNRDHSGDRYSDNIERCFDIDGDGGSLRTEIIIGEFPYRIFFTNKKAGVHNFSLEVKVEDAVKEFKFPIEGKEQIEKLNFDEVIDFIASEIEKFFIHDNKTFNITID